MIVEQALLDLGRIALILIAKGVSTEASKVREALTMTIPNTDHGFTLYHKDNFDWSIQEMGASGGDAGRGRQARNPARLLPTPEWDSGRYSRRLWPLAAFHRAW